jgi:ferrous iron transport protein A
MKTNAAGENFDNSDFQHLGMLRKGDCAIVSGLASSHDSKQLAVKNRLLELGFVPGEKIRVVAESFPHRDPIAVRLGNTTFALRRHEASMIGVLCTLRNAA